MILTFKELTEQWGHAARKGHQGSLGAVTLKQGVAVQVGLGQTKSGKETSRQREDAGQVLVIFFFLIGV